MKRYRLFVFILGLNFLMACQPSKVYNKYIEMDNATWNKFDVIGFDFPVNSTRSDYNIYLLVRFNEQFPQMSLSLNSELIAPGGEERLRDFDIMIKDPYKNPEGQKLQDYYEIRVPLHIEYKFPEKGDARIEISNRMPKYDTPGVLAFGLLVEK